MLWNKRKVERRKDIYLLEFKNYMKNEAKEQGYKEIDSLYKEIKQYYKEKTKDENFDLKIERIQLEKDLGKFEGTMSNLNMALFIGLITAVFPSYLEAFGIFSDRGNAISSIVSFAFFCIILMLQFKNPFKKDKRKEIVLSVSLKVLDDIESENKEKEIRMREESERISNQQMLQQLNDPKRVVKNIAMSALEEVAVGLVKEDGLVRKMFRTKKKC